MISLYAFFAGMIILFAFIGALRGWSREVIAMAGLILALFTINLFGATLIDIFSGLGLSPDPNDQMAGMRLQFIVLGGIFTLIALFSYQSAVFISSRLGRRENLQERILGLIFGAVNGYLVIGTLWGLLEFKIVATAGFAIFSREGWERLPQGINYAFENIISRPEEFTELEELIITHLPIDWLVPALPILLVLIFLFLIIVII